MLTVAHPRPFHNPYRHTKKTIITSVAKTLKSRMLE
jgi:hypothetical protein